MSQGWERFTNAIGAGDTARLLPKNVSKIEVFLGVPPTRISGIHSISVRYLQPRSVFLSCLSGGGRFGRNKNSSGEFIFEILEGAPGNAYMEMFAATGATIPIVIADRTSLSGVVGTGCNLTEVPEWKRQEGTYIIQWNWQAQRTEILHGMRLPVFDT